MPFFYIFNYSLQLSIYDKNCLSCSEVEFCFILFASLEIQATLPITYPSSGFFLSNDGDELFPVFGLILFIFNENWSD